ncbi:MAG: response regulator, partial [Desulfatitalea sp.]
LQRFGYRVLRAPLPGEALVLCEKHPGPIHLLLTDVVMPTMNGNELRERIERLRPGIKTLFMSGYTADAISHRGVVGEGSGFIQKPFSPQALARKVREVLDHGNLMQTLSKTDNQ